MAPSSSGRLRKRAFTVPARGGAEIQKQIGEQFDRHFRAGLAVIGFEKSEDSGTYLIRTMGIKVDRIILRHIRIPLVHFFETSFGRTFDRDIILVEAFAGDVSGWGEVTAGENPFYNEEWTGSIWPLLIDYVAPRVLKYEFKDAQRSECTYRAYPRP